MDIPVGNPEAVETFREYGTSGGSVREQGQEPQLRGTLQKRHFLQTPNSVAQGKAPALRSRHWARKMPPQCHVPRSAGFVSRITERMSPGLLEYSLPSCA